MKKILSLFLIATLIVSFSITALASDTIYVTLDGNYITFDVEPQVIAGRTMVPIRAIFEAMGADVNWDNGTNSAICTKGNTSVKMTVDSTDMYINNEVVHMDVAPVVISGRTLAPARYVAEAFGAQVAWDQDSATVIITTGYPVEETVTLYSMDGRTLTVPESQVSEYLKWGWIENYEDTRQTLYATDGRTLTIFKAYVPDYLKWGWYENYGDTRQTLYAADGRTLTIYKAQVPDYLKWGWYESQYEAQLASQSVSSSSGSGSSYSDSSSSSYNPAADGYYYRTPSGKKYHLDPNCGGKNSYRTTSIGGLSPCSKCAQ